MKILENNWIYMLIVLWKNWLWRLKRRQWPNHLHWVSCRVKLRAQKYIKKENFWNNIYSPQKVNKFLPLKINYNLWKTKKKVNCKLKQGTVILIKKIQKAMTKKSLKKEILLVLPETVKRKNYFLLRKCQEEKVRK